jgi:hypothetical protein
MPFLKKIQNLEVKIDQFLNLVSESSILFEQYIYQYLEKRFNECKIKLSKVRENERKADDLRMEIERYVYKNTLIPENRGDVLAILEGTDEVIDQIKDILIDFNNECPDIPETIIHNFKELVSASAHSVDELIKSVRAFFFNIHDVPNYVHKVFYFEKEADDLSERLKNDVFCSSIDLQKKLHIKYFIKGVEKISDYSQDVGDRLVIYTIKREL